jgi:hypothetical protein
LSSGKREAIEKVESGLGKGMQFRFFKQLNRWRVKPQLKGQQIDSEGPVPSSPLQLRGTLSAIDAVFLKTPKVMF